MDQITYKDRETGQVLTEPLVHDGYQRWVMTSGVGNALFNGILNNSFFCRLYGRLQDTKGSKRKILNFVEQYDIDTREAELELDQFETFNAFFTRKLKADARTFDRDPNAFCCPADGKVMVFPKMEAGTRLPVKGRSISIASFLASEQAAEKYAEGSALVVRLAPYDYHRFHFPDDGTALAASEISGRYHVVNPVGLESVPDAFLRNKRSVTGIDSKHFGQLSYVEVGGFAVGTIVQTYDPGDVERGQEKGYFRFGGSTLVLIFEPGKIVFDGDLVRDSEERLEVQVKAGSRIGRRS
jgi:phosphatidylserine decarboxylase